MLAGAWSPRPLVNPLRRQSCHLYRRSAIRAGDEHLAPVAPVLAALRPCTFYASICSAQSEQPCKVVRLEHVMLVPQMPSYAFTSARCCPLACASAVLGLLRYPSTVHMSAVLAELLKHNYMQRRVHIVLHVAREHSVGPCASLRPPRLDHHPAPAAPPPEHHAAAQHREPHIPARHAY